MMVEDQPPRPGRLNINTWAMAVACSYLLTKSTEVRAKHEDKGTRALLLLFVIDVLYFSDDVNLMMTVMT